MNDGLIVRQAPTADSAFPGAAGKRSDAVATQASSPWGRIRRFIESAIYIVLDAIWPMFARLMTKREWVVVEKDDESFDLFKVRRGATSPFGSTSTLTGSQQSKISESGKRSIELRLLSGKIFSTDFKIPSSAREYAEQVVSNRLDRLAPWRPDNMLYGFALVQDAGASGEIQVNFAATSRDTAEAAIAKLGAIGLTPTMMGSSAEPIDRPLTIDLLRGSADPDAKMKQRLASRLASPLMILLALQLAAAAGSFYAAQASSANLETTRSEVANTRNALTSGTATDTRRAWEQTVVAEKSSTRAVFAVIDRLATIIPQSSYLDQLEIKPDSIALSGLSSDASGLIGTLEAEAELDNARFAAPVTRQQDGRDRFDILVSRVQAEPAQ